MKIKFLVYYVTLVSYIVVIKLICTLFKDTEKTAYNVVK